MYVKGEWNVICDRCGQKFKSSKIRTEWTGLKVCCGAGTNNCHERRHPQDHVKGRTDDQKPAWVRPEQPDVFVTPGPQDWDDL